MTAYYNENNPYAARWLRNLIEENLIAPGIVDDRSILDVRPGDLAGFTQCHFFAGIGGWSYAARLAGWPDDRHLWTGSCPCQPWSKAGRGRAHNDERHLWPEWFRLIGKCSPPVVFGEQVPVAIKRGWLDLVATDLEEAGYAFGSLRARASDVGAPIERQRIWFVAKHIGAGMERQFERSVACSSRPWGWRGQEDLRAVVGSPFVAGDRWPAPLVRRVDHGFAGAVGGFTAYGNAIVPQVAAEIIGAYLDSLDDLRLGIFA